MLTHTHTHNSHIFSLQTGHSLYEQGRPGGVYADLPVSDALSMGIHESQSLLWERMVALSLPFWQHYWPKVCMVEDVLVHMCMFMWMCDYHIVDAIKLACVYVYVCFLFSCCSYWRICIYFLYICYYFFLAARSFSINSANSHRWWCVSRVERVATFVHSRGSWWSDLPTSYLSYINVKYVRWLECRNVVTYRFIHENTN